MALPPPPRAHTHDDGDDMEKRLNHDGGGDGNVFLQLTFSGSVFDGAGGVLINSRKSWRKQFETDHDVEKALEDGAAEEERTGDKWEVRWEDGDPDNPKNLKNWKKWLCTYVVSSASLCVTCTSSVYTSTYMQTEEEFRVPQLQAVAGLSLFVMGLGIGPMVLAPLSEFYGRRPIYLVSFSFFTLFLLPCALAPNIAVLLVFRFFSGMAGSALLSVAGGTIGDTFTGRSLGAPMMIFTACPLVGPEIGPLIGGFVDQNTNWRWTFWAVMVWSFIELCLLYFFVPETYNPVLLRRRAVHLRETTSQPYYAPIEKLTRSIPRTIAWSCLRPFQLLFFEPMVLFLCIFTAILLGVLYLFFEAFPLFFSRVHGFDLESIGLTFLGILVGVVAGILSDPVWGLLRQRLIAKNAGVSEPEFRLPSGILGGVLVPIGLFWFSWTTYESVHWIVPIIASTFFGMGLLFMFSAVFTFLVDAYPLYAASALAANSFLRSSFAAGFPLISGILYERLGFQWAGSILAFLTVAMAPVMVAFFVWGKRIRGRSRFASGG